MIDGLMCPGIKSGQFNSKMQTRKRSSFSCKFIVRNIFPIIFCWALQLGIERGPRNAILRELERVLILSADDATGYENKQTEVESGGLSRCVCTHIHSSQMWEQPEGPSADEQNNKMQCLHTKEYNSA